MVDLLRNFAYAQVTAAVSAGNQGDTLVITVDSNARLPSNTDLSAYQFWMTLESDLPTGSFEIVQLLSTTATSVTVLRGQEGTAATSHPSGMYLKASITAGMYARAVAYHRYVDLGNAAIHGLAVCSVAVGQPNVLRTLVGSVIARAVVTSKLTGTFVLAGHAAGRAVVSASTVTPNVTHPLSGTAAAKATVTASTLIVQGAFSGTAAGKATATGTLTVPSTATSTTYAGRTYASGTY